MKIMASRGMRAVALLTLVASLAACGLPRSGPNKKEIFAGSVLRQGDAFVVSVNPRVTRATAVQQALGFSSAFRNAGLLGSDVIRPGDSLGLTVYENVDDGLLSRGGLAVLDEVQVDGAGFIFVPYAGRIRAAGNTPEALRGVITRSLDKQTPDPQVVVRRLAGDGATVAIVGGVNGQGVYPIERPTRTLLSMLARAGGITGEPETTQITVVRGGQTGRVWLSDLYANPRLDIALRNNDKIILKQDARAFTALGATGAQTRMKFASPTVSALEAIAQVGGLSSNLADPTGVFVFRNEPEAIANNVLGRRDLQGTQRFVYVLDLTEPNGMFEARDFVIRDGDTVYVTEAPFVQWTKTISALTGSLSQASSLSSLSTLGK
ncbi:polysaccharide biosynthesis/export family protein [Brevirhabdus sp.]|uniref:polysaccharide biosynthesis/export family protein n=1 Tax=Brevirhabdus sp. TaxID=2004514 RepID=UPI004057EBD1